MDIDSLTDELIATTYHFPPTHKEHRSKIRAIVSWTNTKLRQENERLSQGISELEVANEELGKLQGKEDDSLSIIKALEADIGRRMKAEDSKSHHIFLLKAGKQRLYQHIEVLEQEISDLALTIETQEVSLTEVEVQELLAPLEQEIADLQRTVSTQDEQARQLTAYVQNEKRLIVTINQLRGALRECQEGGIEVYLDTIKDQEGRLRLYNEVDNEQQKVIIKLREQLVTRDTTYSRVESEQQATISKQQEELTGLRGANAELNEEVKRFTQEIVNLKQMRYSAKR